MAVLSCRKTEQGKGVCVCQSTPAHTFTDHISIPSFSLPRSSGLCTQRWWENSDNEIKTHHPATSKCTRTEWFFYGPRVL